MTNEDKHEVCKYMKWRYRVNEAHVLGTHTDFTFTFCDDGWGRHVVFDLNDAGLCVQEMQKRGEFAPFYDDLLDTYNGLCEDGKATCGADNFTAWLFNPENFFGAMAAWIKEGI